MSYLTIAEYSELGRDADENLIPAPAVPPATTQNITFSTTTQSAALDKRTCFVELCADANCRIVWGTNPTATTTTGTRLPAGAIVFYPVARGYQGANTLKLAVVAE